MSSRIELPLVPVECYGCQTCQFQRGHIIGYKDASGQYVHLVDVVELVIELSAQVAELQAKLADRQAAEGLE